MKKSKYILTLMLTCIFIFGMTGCTNAASIKFSSSKVTVDIQSSEKITLNGVSKSKKTSITTSSKLSKKKKTTKYIYWAVSSPSKASISVKGNTVTITGRAKGSTTVKARYNGKTYSCSVVINAPEEQLEFDPAEINLEETSIPDYWSDEIADGLAKAKGREESGVSTTMYLTDTHWSDDMNTKNSPAIVNYLTDQLNAPFTLFGGDLISNHYTDSNQKAVNEMNDFYSRFTCNMFSTIGNHDLNDYDNKNKKTYLNTSDLYNLMLKREESFAKITSGNVNYAYVDDTTNKVRYISFFYDVEHSSKYTSTTQKWIDKRVKELGSDWSVILISHAYWDATSAGKTNPVPSKSKSIASHFLTLQKESKATIAAWIVGHTHRDLFTTLTTTSGIYRLNIVGVKADSYVKSNRQDTDKSNPGMVAGTDTEQCMNIMQVNTNKKRIYLTRVGAGDDRIIYY